MSDDIEVVHRERVFDGKVFSVDRERVKLPHGPTVTLDVVRHPPSVVLLPVPEPGNVILVRQYRHAIGRWLWEAPAGSVDAGETVALVVVVHRLPSMDADHAGNWATHHSSNLEWRRTLRRPTE